MKRKNKTIALAMSAIMLMNSIMGIEYKDTKAEVISKKQEKGIETYYIKEPIVPNNKKESYIVVAKTEEKVETLSENYVNSSVSEYSNLTDKKMVSLTITGVEADKIQDQSNVLCVEKDVEVIGCAKSFDYRKIQKKKMKKGENIWNKEVIKVTGEGKESKNKVKVAVLDSGICFGNDIEYEEQINLIPGEEEMSPLFVDGSGHGTSVAGILAAEDNEEGVTGINPNIELYSAKVLDDDNSAPISRVVEGIYWAIEKKVNIINISFSTPYHSQILEKAMKDAYEAGILIIAAAGNGDEVEYPAAYPEVMAVGSVNSEGEKSEASASGEELEIMAPGEKVTSTALLGGTMATSGTSLAAPHIVGVASLLWQKDLSVSADFIRDLLNYSANGYGEEKDYGNGLVDYTYAEKIYNLLKVEYDKNNNLKDASKVIDENETKRIIFEENNMVEGKWSGHGAMAADAGAIQSFQDGAKEPDKNAGIKGLVEHQPWHGGMYSNYVANYHYLIKVANAVADLNKDASLSQIKTRIKRVGATAGMNYYVANKVETYKGNVWSAMQDRLCTYIVPELKGRSGNNKKAYMYGVASHVATDVFAHASYRREEKKWEYIQHHFKTINKGKKDEKKVVDEKYRFKHADNIECVVRRYNTANAVLKNIVARYNGNRNSISVLRDFLVENISMKDTERKYYNTSVIVYTEANKNKKATYRLHDFYNYMIKAGETNSSVLALWKKINSTEHTD